MANKNRQNVEMLPPTLLSVKYLREAGIELRSFAPPIALTELLKTFPIFPWSIKDFTFKITGDARPCNPTIVLEPFSLAKASNSSACFRS